MTSASFYRTHLPQARREIAACTLTDSTREVLSGALDLLGVLLASPHADWRPWEDYR